MGKVKACDEISALDEPERTAQRYRTLLEINNAIITSLTQEALLHALSEALRRVISLDRAAITIYDPRREKFRFLAIEGPPSDFFRVGLEVGRGESVCCQAFDEQRSIVRYDLEREQRFPVDRYFLAEGVRSDCFVPLMVGGKAIGTLAISSEKPNQFS
ncbi:MAG: GAF domain-containing protein, partial [Candidatus Rokuibacteriota bacterium]